METRKKELEVQSRELQGASAEQIENLRAELVEREKLLSRLEGEIAAKNDEIVRHRRDANGDGFLDTWSFYRDGELTRQERDLNADGFRDRVGFYQEGRLVREEEDRDGDGQPDRVTLFDDQERIHQLDEDRGQ